jgi:Ni/Fe-hydrogenase subunit HybB-like protein
MNMLHVPVALGAIFALPVIVLLSRGRRVRRSAAALSLFVLIVLAGNAVICGVLSNPHARYQSRLVWLAPLALVVALAGMRRPVLAAQSPHFRRNKGLEGSSWPGIARRRRA